MATWSAPIEYTITYTMNGGTNHASNPATYTVEDSLITLLDPTKAGYTFTSWTPTDNIPAGSTGNKTFVATWSAPIEYTITYTMDGGTNNPGNPATYTIESALITLLNPARSGYNFAGWTPAGNIPAGSTGNKAFAAAWTIIPPPPADYDVLYNENGGSSVPNEFGIDPGDLVTEPANPTRTGFDFDGWFTDDGTFLIEWDFGSDMTLHAKWTGLTYTVTWNNWDDSQIEQDLNVPYGDDPSYDGAEPTRPPADDSEYTFGGWTPTVSPVTGDITYTAQYTSGGRGYVIRWEDWDGTLLRRGLRTVWRIADVRQRDSDESG